MADMSSVEDTSQKTFTNTWKIKNWEQVTQRNNGTFENTSTEFKLESGSMEYAAVLIGFSFSKTDSIGVYFKFLRKLYCIENMKADLVIEILKGDGNVGRKFKGQTAVKIGKTIETVKSFWNCGKTNSSDDGWICSEGCLTLNLTCTLKNLPKISDSFYISLQNEYSQDLAALLDDKNNCDVKIVTRDKTEISAHKNILMARCPSIFGSVYSKNEVNVDVSDKTMNIFLHYWYTGVLQASWMDDDTVVEFGYTAHNYGMTRLLNWVNNFLGYDFEDFHIIVELFEMTQQLSLKQAEARLFKLAIEKIRKSKSATEVLEMFYMVPDLYNEKLFSVPEALKACNDAISENDRFEANTQHVRLMAFACKLGQTDFEQKLLNRIKNTVEKFCSVDELFVLFEVKFLKNENVSKCDDTNPGDDLHENVNSLNI